MAHWQEWDELCVLSGIRPGGGPERLLMKSDIGEVAFEMVYEIESEAQLAQTPPTMTASDLNSIINEALTLATSGPGDDHDDVSEPKIPAWFENHISDWPGSQTSVAIGYFNEDGEALTANDVYQEDEP
jgi:hypothetical protein